jgi:tetratricopeptide (TPR) repeat protein
MWPFIAGAYSTAGNNDKALAIFKRALEIREDPATYLNLAGIYSRLGLAEEASKDYAKVIELKSDVPNVMKIYADLLRDNGRRREALEMYKRSLAMLPTNGPALFNAGILSAKLGEIEAARQYLEVLKTADPTTAKLLDRYLRLKLWR